MTRRKRYNAEFKREALRRANEEGVTDVLVARKQAGEYTGIGKHSRLPERKLVRTVSKYIPTSGKRAFVLLIPNAELVYIISSN